MDERITLLAENLLLIERELRLQGWWNDSPPSESALASQAPFCVDTLAFEQWLQWIFLPRMKELLEMAAPLPAVSGMKPMAEIAFREVPVQATRLIELLETMDAHLSGITPKDNA